MSKVEFSVDSDVFKSHIDFVKSGLGVSDTNIANLLVLMRLEGTTLHFFTSNNDMFCITSTEVSLKGSCEGVKNFSILGSKLTSLVQVTDTESITFTVEEGVVGIKVGLFQISLIQLDSKVISSLLDMYIRYEDCSDYFEVDSSILRESVLCASSCTTVKSVRSELMHVQLRRGKVISTDGRRVMIYDAPNAFPKDKGFKIPSSCITQSVICMKHIPSSIIKVSEESSHFVFSGNNVGFIFGVRKVDSDIPDIENQVCNVEVSPEDEISIDAASLDNAVKSTSIGIDTDSEVIRFEVHGEDRKAYIEISALNSLQKRSYKKASVSRGGSKSISFPISYKHLLETLKTSTKGGIIDIEVRTPGNYLVVKDETDVRIVYTLIPFRTSNELQEEIPHPNTQSVEPNMEDVIQESDVVDSSQELDL
jgi:hypothetical protein